MTYFSGENLELIEALVYDPTLKPDYDIMRDSLVWPDERPQGLDPDAYEKLIDLWIARSFIHKGISFSDHRLDPEYFERVWKEAREQGFQWPGFHRLHLSEPDREFYENARNEFLAMDGDDF
ncbi:MULTISPECIES: hypothetical protein [unclassified Roseofilum]|uniref:hypothetical protein n=1 Tax=unclassified Roseofilum TaxID=2620099 RepID=UPI001B141D23|nr:MULTISPECIES: hypothetical protein [unclassified Roseofilum]MBP0011480.1 hypothetical protein [Roseofilum sp. Belize Diploria]MBP0036055.1 hypothetical protein [Roseofilum sp. Belize BBD 4]